MSLAWKKPMPGLVPDPMPASFSCQTFHGTISSVCSPSARRSVCTQTIGPEAITMLSAMALPATLQNFCEVSASSGTERPQKAPGISS